MMRKGVSPVVATVLLIAIAVISAVAVWYWVAPLTSPQAAPSTVQYGVSYNNIYKTSTGNCTTIDIRNSGGLSIPANTAFQILPIAGGNATGRYVNITTTLTSGSTSNFVIGLINGSNSTPPGLAVGSYLLRVYASPSGLTGYTDAPFTC